VSPLLIVRLSILNMITLTKCLDHQTKKLLPLIPLPWAFCFSLSSFPNPSTWSSWPPHHQHDHHHCFTTWNIYQPISHTLRAHRLVDRVSSVHQNQTRAFNLPLFGNWWEPFDKDMSWKHFEFMLLAQAYLPCVKVYGKVSWIWIGSIAPPIYVLRVWIEACTYA
jgi:hypothetical protein